MALPLAVQQESCDFITNQAGNKWMSYLPMLQYFYVQVINTWQLMKHQGIDNLQNLLEYDGLRDAYFEFQNGDSRILN